jgi:putative peptidoglycan lipid II flippase
VLKSSAIFSGLTMVSRLAGFARDLAVTAFLGASAGPAADAYNTALSFPNLFRRIFAEGAFAAAFVPAYAKTLKQQGDAEADRVATDALAAVAVVTLILTVIAQLAMHVAQGLPWGNSDDKDQLPLSHRVAARRRSSPAGMPVR